MTSSNPLTRSLRLSPEIAQMGFTDIQIQAKNMIIKHQDGLTLLAKYDAKDLIKTTKLLEGQLAEHIGQPIGLPEEFNIKAFTAALSITLIQDIQDQHTQKQGEQQRERQREQAILNEINELKERYANISCEEWRQKLLQKYKDLQSIIMEKMPEIWPGLEFELSILRILSIEGCTLPFIGIILGRPSSYKTVIISLLKRWANAFYTDNFTARSFVSHSTAVNSKEELEEIDMLPKIKGKLFLTPELSPMFTTKEEDLIQLLGIITRVADGHGYVSDSGAHGHRGYDEDIMFTWTGAAVDIPYKVYKVLGNLGAKLYFYRMKFDEHTTDQLMDYAIDDEEFNPQVLEIQNALYDYLKWFEICPVMAPKMKWDKSNDSRDALRYIVGMADLLSYLRCVAQVWETNDTQGSEYAYSISQREVPRGAITCLKNLARGHALLAGRNYITLDDISIIIKTALDTAPIERVSLFSLLIANNGTLTTTQILSSLNVARKTALRTMAELKAIGLVSMEDFREEGQNNYSKRIILVPRFNWFLSDPMITKIIPHTLVNLNSEAEDSIEECPKADVQEIKFWQVYDELLREEELSNDNYSDIDKNTISGKKLEKRLMSTGEFYNGDAVKMIKRMVNAGKLSEVMLDTYRRI
jgi:hypothetical protein